MLVARAGVVDIVKVHAVVIGRLVRHGVLLVDQRRGVRPAPLQRAAGRGRHGRDHLSAAVHRADLPPRRGRAIERHPNVSPGEGQHAARRAGDDAVLVGDRRAHGQPLEALAAVEERRRLIGKRHAVVGHGKGELRIRDAAVIVDVEALMALAQVDDHLLPRDGGGVAVLRRARRAQVPEAHHGIRRRDRQQDEPFPPGHVQAVIPGMQQPVAQAALAVPRLVLPGALRAALPQAHGRAPQRQAHARPDRQRRRDQLQDAQHIAQPLVGRDQVLKGQHHADIHRRRRAGKHAGGQHAHVACLDVGQQQQRQRRQDVALVHLAAQHEHQLHRHRAGQDQPPSPLPAQVHANAEGKAQRHQRDAQPAVGDPAQHRHGIAHPVAAQQVHQVAGGERGVVVAGERLDVFIHDPQRGRLACGERQHEHRRHQQPQPHADGRRPARLPAPHEVARQRSHAQRRQQTCLRLGQHSQRKRGDRQRPLAHARQQQHAHQHQRQHGVDLPPARPGDHERGVQRHQRRHAQRAALPGCALRRQVDGHSQQHVAGDGHGLEQQLAARRAKRHVK